MKLSKPQASFVELLSAIFNGQGMSTSHSSPANNDFASELQATVRYSKNSRL